jgi:hypothetical protein
MLADDHELRDDWGDRPEDSEPESIDFFIGSLALQVYHEYQTQVC